MTTDGTNYVMIPESEAQLLKSETVLTWKDAEELLEYQDVFMKFLDKTRFSYQIELSKWTYRGKEEFIYIAIDVIDDIKKSLKSIEKAFKERNKQREKGK